MAFEDVMAAAGRWLTATEALAAVGAELSLADSAEPADPDISRALRAVSAAAGLPDLGQLPPPQRDVVIAMARMCLRQSLDLLDDPARSPGWTFTDPAIMDGWGRGSMMVPGAVTAAVPELAGTTSFLDVGTGVGLLAVAAARTWPNAAVTGIDIWEPALKLAEANVARAGLTDRITLRAQDVTSLDDEDRYDLAWFPTFFVSEQVLTSALPRLLRAIRPGGRLILGRMATPPDPLAAATTALRTIRGGGADFGTAQLTAALEAAGWTGITIAAKPPSPLEYVIAKR
jgi:predicted O-methyltransferase YrrM